MIGMGDCHGEKTILFELMYSLFLVLVISAEKSFSIFPLRNLHLKYEEWTVFW